jgi:hypothetical protein
MPVDFSNTYPRLKYAWQKDSPGFKYQRVEDPDAERELGAGWYDTPREAMNSPGTGEGSKPADAPHPENPMLPGPPTTAGEAPPKYSEKDDAPRDTLENMKKKGGR